MPTIFELKKSYGADQAKLLTSTFDIAVAAGAIDAELSDEVRANLDAKSDQNVRAAQGFIWGAEARQMIKDKYLELDLELRQAIDIRLEEIEEELRPENASFADFAAAAAAPEDALRIALDMSLSAGDEDGALVAFSAARQRNLEQVVAHAVTIREDWGDLLGEIAEAEAEVDMEPGDKFELLARPTPTAAEIKNGLFSAPQTNANTLGKMQ
ncbi:MAG: hypothetical protein H0U17_01990 [Actinobacteria bacterium]|jgi:hypothetical protein|nr:hypothetical protein [Actinomycetota bacterium]